jgi:hypothetical protein
MTDAAAAARQMWGLFEPVHTVTYFASEALSAFEGAGCAGSGAATSPAGPRRSARSARRR